MNKSYLTATAELVQNIDISTKTPLKTNRSIFHDEMGNSYFDSPSLTDLPNLICLLNIVVPAHWH